jgi:thiaminase/transcriptional activator TenA
MTGSELLTHHPDEWRAATNHPFLDAVREGSLPPQAFVTWLAQDYLFVAGLLPFQAQLLANAPRAGQRALAEGIVALEAELGWFEAIASRLGLNLDVEPHATTAAYLSHLQAHAGRWRAGITCLWTGERGYLESWRRVAPGPAAYREYIEHWTSPDFDTYVAALEGLVDAAGADEAAFLATCRLEEDFWEMAWSSARA